MLLTIVTINLNNANGLRRTLASLEPLLDLDIEHLVIDGGSTDGSQELLSEWQKHHKNVRVLVESDTGIYNAMNKGWRLAQGQYVAYINSGDEAIPAAYAKYVSFLQQSTADVCYAKILVRSEDGSRSFEFEMHPSNLKRCTIPHPSAAVKRAAFSAHGGFDEQYRICADREFFIRLQINRCTFEFMNECNAIFYEGGISSRRETRLENIFINFRYGFITREIYMIKRVLYAWQAFMGKLKAHPKRI